MAGFQQQEENDETGNNLRLELRPRGQSHPSPEHNRPACIGEIACREFPLSVKAQSSLSDLLTEAAYFT